MFAPVYAVEQPADTTYIYNEPIDYTKANVCSTQPLLQRNSGLNEKTAEWIPFLSTSNSVLYGLNNIWNEMYMQYCKVTGASSQEMLPILRMMVKIAMQLPIKDYCIDYSHKSKTLDMSIWLEDGIRFTLAKSAKTLSDNLIAYTVGIKRDTLVVDIAEESALRESMAGLVRDLQFKS